MTPDKRRNSFRGAANQKKATSKESITVLKGVKVTKHNDTAPQNGNTKVMYGGGEDLKIPLIEKNSGDNNSNFTNMGYVKAVLKSNLALSNSTNDDSSTTKDTIKDEDFVKTTSTTSSTVTNKIAGLHSSNDAGTKATDYTFSISHQKEEEKSGFEGQVGEQNSRSRTSVADKTISNIDKKYEKDEDKTTSKATEVIIEGGPEEGSTPRENFKGTTKEGKEDKGINEESTKSTTVEGESVEANEIMSGETEVLKEMTTDLENGSVKSIQATNENDNDPSESTILEKSKQEISISKNSTEIFSEQEEDLPMVIASKTDDDGSTEELVTESVPASQVDNKGAKIQVEANSEVNSTEHATENVVSPRAKSSKNEDAIVNAGITENTIVDIATTEVKENPMDKSKTADHNGKFPILVNKKEDGSEIEKIPTGLGAAGGLENEFESNYTSAEESNANNYNSTAALSTDISSPIEGSGDTNGNDITVDLNLDKENNSIEAYKSDGLEELNTTRTFDTNTTAEKFVLEYNTKDATIAKDQNMNDSIDEKNGSGMDEIQVNKETTMADLVQVKQNYVQGGISKDSGIPVAKSESLNLDANNGPKNKIESIFESQHNITDTLNLEVSTGASFQEGNNQNNTGTTMDVNNDSSRMKDSESINKESDNDVKIQNGTTLNENPIASESNTMNRSTNTQNNSTIDINAEISRMKNSESINKESVQENTIHNGTTFNDLAESSKTSESTMMNTLLDQSESQTFEVIDVNASINGTILNDHLESPLTNSSSNVAMNDAQFSHENNDNNQNGTTTIDSDIFELSMNQSKDLLKIEKQNKGINETSTGEEDNDDYASTEDVDGGGGGDDDNYPTASYNGEFSKNGDSEEKPKWNEQPGMESGVESATYGNSGAIIPSYNEVEPVSFQESFNQPPPPVASTKSYDDDSWYDDSEGGFGPLFMLLILGLVLITVFKIRSKRNKAYADGYRQLPNHNGNYAGKSN